MKPGDRLAFRIRGGTEGAIHKVDRVTPTGRIVAGPYTMNPDLSIRGRGGPWPPSHGEPVTPAIEAAVTRLQLVRRAGRVQMSALPNALLERIIEEGNK